MINLRYPIAFYVFIFSQHLIFSEQNIFKAQEIEAGLFINETQIKYYKNAQEIGYISYTKIPILPFYVIHSFYIYPQCRTKGYGTKLLCYTCNTLKVLGAKKIYIQPGPFEIQNNAIESITDTTKSDKMKSLVALYLRAGFTFTSKWISWSAFWLYKLLGIDEDSSYLMVKSL